jgi:hypothetical protein
MSANPLTHNQNLALTHGQAVIVFGPEAVKAVLRDAEWIDRTPEVASRLRERDEITRSQTMLPGEIVYAIAGREDCIYDFYATPDGDRLFARHRHRQWTEPRAIDVEIEKQRMTKIPAQEALLEYGAYCLFMAADNIYGRKGERDPRTLQSGS